MYFERTPVVLRTARTVRRAIFDEEKTSSPSSWRERFTVVSTTLCAFFEVKIATVIMTPAPIRKKCLPGNWLSPANTCTIYSVGLAPLPLAVKSRNDSSPAKGVPIKLTKSLPAKAIAKAKVPNKTTMRKMFTLQRWSISIITVKTQKLTSRM